jgi:uncharacterized membrane protein
VRTILSKEPRSHGAPHPDEPRQPAPRRPATPTRRGPPGWLVPAGLLLLGLLPLVFGALRLTQLAGGPAIMPANARIAATPLVLHIVGGAVLAVLGAFQFSAGFRRRHPGWHRLAGRLVVVGGLLAGLSGLWMTLFYLPQPGSGALLYAFRLVFGSAMVVSIVLGFTAIRRGDVGRHRAWITRGYAIGLGAVVALLGVLARPSPPSLSTVVTGDAALAARARPLLPGALDRVSVAVVDGAAVTYAGFGADEHAEYEIGSITKTFTGALLADAIRRGEVSADTRVGALLPLGGAPVADATLEELASHRSGLSALGMQPDDALPFALRYVVSCALVIGMAVS